METKTEQEFSKVCCMGKEKVVQYQIWNKPNQYLCSVCRKITEK